MNKNFLYFLNGFFKTYLPVTRNLSPRTIETYKYSFRKLLDFFEINKKIYSSDITLEMFNVELIEEFIDWLLNDENNSSKTVNNRLTTIKTYFLYVSIQDVKYIYQYMNIKNIKCLKTNEKLINYLSLDEINILFSIPNSQNKKELKELAILTLLYEGALRVSELCNLKLCDIEFSDNTIIKIITTKNNKSRIVPISKDVEKILQKYINIYKIEHQDYLFTNRYGNQYTRWGINDIIDKNINKAKNNNNDKFNIKVTSHIFRHSKAMHLLNAGIRLTTIEKLLGHSSIISTEIYAKASSKKVQQAINDNSQAIKVKRKYNQKNDVDIINWIKN